ncbi:MAG TPA: hypothetical protein VFU38_06475 [Candidatus Krumholzibacteria bacterium]|nr:hypothetical protein [Candidatus Krumholzibacteria bacterium]
MMKRTIIIAAILLLLVIVGISVYLYNSMDALVAGAIEKHGTRIMGTKVSVGSVDISLKTGKGTIRNVEVENPEGYSDDKLFTLEEVAVDIDVKSINRDPIVIDEVRISAPKVRVEVDEKGQSNVTVVRANVDKYRSASVPREQKQDGGFEKRILIEKFVFEKGLVDIDATSMGVTAFDEALPPLRLSNVGGPNGDTPDAIGKEISREFLAAVRSVVQDKIRQRATDKAKEVLTREADKALDKIFNRKAANDSTR